VTLEAGRHSGLAMPDAERSVRIDTPRRRFVRRFGRNNTGLIALALLVALVLVAIAAPVITPYNPNLQLLRLRLQAPNGAHLLGTDDLGRDVLSRLLVASRISLLAALLATAISAVLGVPLGLLAGFTRGWVDTIVSRVTDTIMAVPALLFALAIVGILGRNVTNAMIAIGFVNAPRFVRVLRGSTMVVRSQPYIEAAQATGSSTLRVLLQHVLPNVVTPLIVQLSLSMGFAILFEAAISFLGLGVQPPDASWGTMLGRSTQFMEKDASLVIFPGLAIFLTVLTFNLLGDAINDALASRQRG
jgi:peptide/nickel transport system permease protein